ncbi:nucleotidyltransferase family protein [Bradyrhizobium sp. LHD-71]|uniref:nucleotidyltransferase family protein n=1 Tax=Bradyrhizobium sp. LHD-71 TaxID=3072141 RepID=UPI00280F0DE5|nr:nucleotidyltransferase family protein [Bradyrhizobium sp. LHD-71]MDQ8731819.1 nucleotidyltransferase family protein [Bradyrhizobium sp. LHD-71]
MKSIDDVVGFIERQPELMRVLELVEALSLPDCWIGAGFVRNAVWDALHGRPAEGGNDVDVAYFDPANASGANDAALEARLRATDPRTVWDVKNQARMHVRNGDAPYLDTEDAVACWPETATAVAVRRQFGRTELIAPHGIDDLIGVVARPTPAFRTRPEVVMRRVCGRRWQSRWPQLRVLER